MIRAAIAAILATALATTLAAGADAKTRQPTLPPYAGAYQPQGVDERGIWMEADEAERTIRDSQFVIRDAALNTYVREVLCRTVGPDRCGGVRIYVMRAPVFNASMTPNGMMVVYSGALLRMRCEAELAALLAHEFSHFEERHSLAGYRNSRTNSDILSWAAFGGQTGALVQILALGSTYSFSRQQETDADVKAFAYIAASEYRPGAFADLWSRQMDEADATAMGRKRRSNRYDQVAFFATHPTTLDRRDYLRALAAKNGDEGESQEARFREAVGRWQQDFLADQIKINDFEGTEYLLREMGGPDPAAHILAARAELYRNRGHPRDLVSAIAFYREAIAKGASAPAVHRGLGMALMRSGDAAGGKQALAEYLRLDPAASDRAIVQTLLQ